jgi:surface polysaccharide O-acyltransferase-like enzyme
MIKQLLLLNGLAVIGAVVNHASGWGYTSLFWWTDRYEHVTVPNFSQMGTASYYALRVLEQLITFSLPAFLFVSGFFVAFAAGRDAKLGWDKVGTRVKMLVIPYLLWSLAIFVGRSMEGSTDSAAGYAEQLLFGRAAIPYYYIPLITQLYLFSPFFVTRMKNHWKPVLITAALIQVVVQLARYPVLLGWDAPAAGWIWRHAPGWFFPHMVFWFVFGVFAGLHLPAFRELVARWQRALPWVTVALGVLALLEWELLLRFSGKEWLTPTPTLLDSFYSVAFILTVMSFAQSKIAVRRPLDALGERSFGVYLVHAPVLELVSRTAYHVAPVLLAYQFAFQPLLIVAGVGVPILIMLIVNRSPARPYYNYLFG